MSNPSIDDLVRCFSEFLSSAWDSVSALERQYPLASLLEDWKQANWEMLVESYFWKDNVFLVVYGGGADIESDSSRVSRVDRRATHRVMARAVHEEVTDLLSGRRVSLARPDVPMSELVSAHEGWYHERPPFDCLCVRDGGATYLVPISDLRFELSSVGEGED